MFRKAVMQQAFLKAGFMGFQGAGKTFTAACLMLGLILHARKLKLPYADKPVGFVDSETGSDWVIPMFEEHGVELVSVKTQSFKDLLDAMDEAEKECSGLIIDSITHFWREFTESYQDKKKRKRIEFSDWNFLKSNEGWGRYTSRYVNSNLHIAMCGRAGFEYDFFEDEDGKKQIEKTGVKMKAETETGFEPSLLVHMERQIDASSNQMVRVAHVVKDRGRLLDGKSFGMPHYDNVTEAMRHTYGTFVPHIKWLALGGEHVGVDLTRNSKEMIPGPEGKSEFAQRKLQRAILLEKLDVLMAELGVSGTAKEAVVKRAAMLKSLFGTDSRTEIDEVIPFEFLRSGVSQMHIRARGVDMDGNPPVNAHEEPEEEPGGVANGVAEANELTDAVDANVEAARIAKSKVRRYAEPQP
jgi:hypothetical protein